MFGGNNNLLPCRWRVAVPCRLIFPFALRFGDVFFGKLRDAVKLIPKQAELLVDGFLFLLAAVGGSYPFVVFDNTDMQGRVVGMGDDFDDPQDGKGVYEPEGFPTDQRKMRLQSR